MQGSSTSWNPHDRLIAGLRAVGSLSPEDEAAARQLPLRIQPIGPHTDVLREGDRPTECCLILDGFFVRHKSVAGGHRQILSFHMLGDIPDLECLLLPTVHYSLGSLTPGRVAFIPHAALRQTVLAAPELGDLLWRATLLDASILRAWLVSIGRRPAYQRVAHLFCEVFMRMRALGIAEETGFTLPITQMEMADALGLSAVHINRTLQQLRQDGVIVSHGKYHGFTDWDRLSKAGDFDPGYLFSRGDA